MLTTFCLLIDTYGIYLYLFRSLTSHSKILEFAVYKLCIYFINLLLNIYPFFMFQEISTPIYELQDVGLQASKQAACQLPLSLLHNCMGNQFLFSFQFEKLFSPKYLFKYASRVMGPTTNFLIVYLALSILTLVLTV